MRSALNADTCRVEFLPVDPAAPSTQGAEGFPSTRPRRLRDVASDAAPKPHSLLHRLRNARHRQDLRPYHRVRRSRIVEVTPAATFIRGTRVRITVTAVQPAPAQTASEFAPFHESDQKRLVTIATGRRWLAVLRLATGFIFLWAFFDKAFGLGFSTPTERAWINGGAPSQGFLNSDAVVGPLKPFFAAIASPATDVLFMLGMLAIGLAVMLGVGLRVSAVVGSILMLAMYLAEWPFGPNAASNNPLVDYHIIYALALIVVAVLAAGDTWGIGRRWRALPAVQHNRWLV